MYEKIVYKYKLNDTNKIHFDYKAIYNQLPKDKKPNIIILFGKRSNGKSFQACVNSIDDVLQDKGCILILKRYEKQLTPTFMESYISADIDNYIYEKYGYHTYYSRRRVYMYKGDEPPEKTRDMILLAKFQALTQNDALKGSQELISNIILEEAISTDGIYLQNEVNILLNLVNTFDRNRGLVKLWIVANTISKINPYSDMVGVELDTMKKGSAFLFEYKKKTDRMNARNIVLFVRTDNIVQKNLDNVRINYNLLDYDYSAMIDDGDFENYNIFDMSIKNKKALPLYVKTTGYTYLLYLCDVKKNKYITFKLLKPYEKMNKNYGVVGYDGVRTWNITSDRNDIDLIKYIVNLINNDCICGNAQQGTDIINAFIKSGAPCKQRKRVV